MNTRKFLVAALGLRGIVPPVLTRAMVTAVLVAPALWSHVETRIIGLADPASLKQTVPNGISVVSGSIAGMISQDKAVPDELPKSVLRSSPSPLDREFSELVAQVHSSSGESAISLLQGLKSFFASTPSLETGSMASLNGAWKALSQTRGGILGSNLLSAAGYGAPPNQFWSDAAPTLVPINEHRLSFDGDPGSKPSVATGYWTTPNVMPVVDMAPGIPAAPVLNSASSVNNDSGGWSSSFDNSPATATWSPPPASAYQSEPAPASTPSTPSYVPFHSASLGYNPGVSTAAPMNTMPHVSSGIVLASIPTVPTATTTSSSFATAAVSSGITGSSGTVTASASSVNINYQFVTIGDPGNTAYNATTGLGQVNSAYNIGKYDVTVSQYATFLNAVAATDPYGLYNTQMNDDPTIAGISRTGAGTVASPYVYAVIGDGNHPITYVSWFDAARMANWMQNGQPTGLGEVAASTEQGAYTLNGATAGIITVNANAKVWIPTESQWFKAAYYDPQLNSGKGGYWTYATQSNSQPGNSISTPTAANQANYDNFFPGNGYTVTQSTATPNHDPSTGSTNYLTDVGYFTGSGSYYGTFDQAGLVYNWTDAVIAVTSRGTLGGSWETYTNFMSDAQIDNGQLPTVQNPDLGIRFAALAVPEPSVVFSLLAGGGLLLLRRRKSARHQARA